MLKKFGVWVSGYDISQLIKLIVELEGIKEFRTIRKQEGFIIDIYADDETIMALLMMLSALRRGDPTAFIGITYMVDYSDWCARCYTEESDIIEVVKKFHEQEEDSEEEGGGNENG